MGRFSMTGDTLPGTCSRVKRDASGNSSHRTSRHRSPPRIPVSQSWTRAIRGHASAVTRPRALGAGAPYALPPVVEQIAQRLLEGNVRSPPRGPLDLARIADEQGHVGGAHAVGPGLDGHGGGARGLDEKVQDFADGPRLARAQIVNLSRFAALQEGPVAPHDVAHVGEVSPRLEVAHLDDRLPASRLDLRHLAGEVRRREDLAAARAAVIEGARAYDR